MRVSYTITCKNRLFQLERSLSGNLANNPNAEFVVVDYASEDGLEAWILRHFKSEIAKGRVVFYKMLSSPYLPFNDNKYILAHAKNVSALLCSGEIVCNLDCDNYAGDRLEDYLIDIFTKDPKAVVAGLPGEIHPSDTWGKIAIQKDVLVSLGGYDERLWFGWGYEDTDMLTRAVASGCNRYYLERKYLKYMAHSDELRVMHMGGLPKKQTEAVHQAMSQQSLEKKQYVANVGRSWGEATLLCGEDIVVTPHHHHSYH